MTCADCGHDNDTNANFCSGCGTPLAVTCPSCAAAQPAAGKFCNRCGTALDASAEPSIPAAVRKSVTAVFTDLVGSTAFGERLDPEAVRAAIRPYHELVTATVEDHAGTVVKFMGDGAMAVFGLPELAEDDAIRAVRAGIDLQRRFRSFADGVHERHGVELGLRVGINSGELVVSDADADLVGDVLNTAARLEAACEPGGVLVGEDTWRLTRSTVEYEVLGEVRVKGKADPIATFRVVDGDRTIADDIPFVGRRAELDELLGAFAEARESPVARLVTVIGAPGVGKTRLAAELRAAVDARSFDLRFERRGSATFAPIAQLLRVVTDGTVEGIARLLAEHPDHERVVPVVNSFLGHGAPRTTEESFWAVRRLLEHLAATEPLIVVVDDIQWAEPLFWDLLDHLVEWTQAPVLLVALARPELRELRPELAQSGRRVAAAIALEGLDVSSTRELAARLLDTDDVPGELMERIPDSTEGNPLFVRELVQMLVDDGTLARDGDRWRLTIDADAIEVPPTILSLLASRVERLPDDERRVLELASVIGTDFVRGPLAAIAPADVAGRLGALLDRLRRKDLIEPSGAWAGDHQVYRFHHVLIRDAAYRRLLKRRRAELHERVGRLYDTGESTGEADVVVAHHFEQTVRYRTELSEMDDSTRALAEIAIARLQRAADTALEREDLLAAGGYARRALAMAELTDPTRDELLLLGCEALLASGDVAGATPMVEELHERSSDERLAAWADCFRAQRWSLTDADRLTESAELADRAATRLTALDDQAGVAKARLVRAGCLARLGRIGDCEEELDVALGAARAASDRRRTVAVLGAAPLAALWGPSPVARAGGRCLDVLRLLRITTASPAVEATSIRCQGVLEALRGRFDSARTKLAASRATAQELGLRQGFYETELFAGFVELWAGDPRAAEPHLRAARTGLGRLGIGADAGRAAALLATALLDQGEIDEAEALAGEALETAGQNLQTAIAARTALAEVHSAKGSHGEAERFAGEALAIAARTDSVVDHALAHLSAGRVAGADGDAAAAARHERAAARLLAGKGVERQPTPTDTPPTEPEPPTDVAVTPSPADTTAVLGGAERREVTAARARAPTDEDGGAGSPTLGNRASNLLAAGIAAVTAGDPGGLARALAPDCRIINRHRFQLGAEVERDDLIQMVIGSRTAAADFEQTMTLVAIRGDDLCLAEVDEWFDGSHLRHLLVVESDANRLITAVFHDDTAHAEALEELDRLWTERTRRVAPTDAAAANAGSTASPEGNHASRLIWEFQRDGGPGNRERFHELLHPDFVSTPHYRLHIGQQLGRDQFIDVNIRQFESADHFRDATELVAWRGDRLCVTHVTTVFDDSAIEYNLVVEESEGQVISLDLFDQTQLNEALDELDRRWVEQGGPVGHVHAPMRIRHAFAARDATALRDCVTDDSLAIDHRPLGVGTRDADQWAESMRPMFAEDGSTIPIWRQWARCDEHIGLYQLDLRTTDGSIWDIWVLQVVAGNRLAHTELFDRDELDLALARYDELRADTEHVRDPADRAALARRSAPGARRRLGPRPAGEHAHDTG